MERRIFLGVCILSALCLQTGETQTITKRVRELCSALQNPNGRAPPPGADPDYYDDLPEPGNPKGTRPNGRAPPGADPDYDYPAASPKGTRPNGRTPPGADPDDDYYNDYDVDNPRGGSPTGRNPKGGAPDEEYDDYGNPIPPTRGSPNRKTPLLDEYGDPLYDEDALGQPDYPDYPLARGKNPNNPNSPNSPNNPRNRGNPKLPRKDDMPKISLTVVCGGKATNRRVL